MDDFLTPVSTTYLKPQRDGGLSLTQQVGSPTNKPQVEARQIRQVSQISSADEALEILRGQPDYDSLILVLRYLLITGAPPPPAAEFNIHTPGSKSAAVVHQLVSEIASNYWTLLCEGSEDKEDATLFIQCLQNVAGLNALLSHLNALIREYKGGGGGGASGPRRPDVVLHLRSFLSLLSTLLEGVDSIRTIWTNSTRGLSNATMKRTQSLSLLSLLASGRILSVASEAEAEALEPSGEDDEVQPRARWIAQGIEYTKWIAENIVSWAKEQPQPQGPELQFCSDLFQRALSLGYADTLAKGVIDGLLLTKGHSSSSFSDIFFSHPQSSKKTLHILLHHLSSRLDSVGPEETTQNAAISAAAGILHRAIQRNDDGALKSHLIDWCTSSSSSAAGLGDGVGIRRAVVAVLAQDKNGKTVITDVLEKSLAQFGDQLYIRHVAVLQQNVHTEILLLSAGYVSRLSPIKMRIIVRSGPYLSAISNRIAATQSRARFLGMVVGEALSALCDNQSQRLDFHDEEMEESEEAQRLQALTRVSDQIGPIDPLLLVLSDDTPTPIPQPQPQTKSLSKPSSTSQLKLKPKSKPKPKASMNTSASKPVAIIEEIDSSDEDDLVPYAKGSDPEDSEDDATLVQRNKPKAPVYIRDLISYLRDSESCDKQSLALHTAPSLIRRKATFGTEVSSHADELARLLVALQDRYDIEDFSDLKLQAMIALTVAQPKAMAPWFCRTFFEGDYSLTQRVQVLVAVGISARELAGLEISRYASASSFPSKRLPEKMEQMYLGPASSTSTSTSTSNPSSRLKALPPTALESISQSLTASFLAPMAAEAADKSTGPDILKLETFAARYKSSKSAKANRPRVRAIPNTTAALLANSFFFPLTAHFQLALRSSRPIVLNPALLSLYLQTLGVVIHAAGPSTLSLPQLTAELWDLLLATRVHAEKDVSALRGWMVCMASLLQVNEGDMRRVCEQQAREVVETREWVGLVFQRIRGGEDGGEENDVKMLAAGVLIRLGEAVDKFQALLMGDMIG